MGTSSHGDSYLTIKWLKIYSNSSGLSDDKGLDKMPYTNVAYANGKGYNSSFPHGRKNLTGVDTREWLLIRFENPHSIPGKNTKNIFFILKKRIFFP